MTSTKKIVERCLSENLEAKGWHWQSVCKLPPVFLKNVEISPVFLPNIIRRRDGSSLIDGYLGILCRPFERLWLSHKMEQHPNRYCLMINIANIPDLLHSSIVHDESIHEDLSEFCLTLATLLEKLPHDISDLRMAFRNNELIGLPILKFELFGQHEKFGALADFLNSKNSVLN